MMKISLEFIVSSAPGSDCAPNTRGADNSTSMTRILTDGVVKVGLFLGGQARRGFADSDFRVTANLRKRSSTAKGEHFE